MTPSLAGLSGLAIVPAFVGHAVGTPLAAVLGHLAVGFTTLAVSAAARRLRPRFDTALAVELRTSSALRVIAVLIVLGQLVALDLGATVSRTFGTSALLVGVATLAAFSARRGVSSVWSFVAGVLIATAVSIVPFASSPGIELRLVAVPLAAAVALCAGASIGARASRATGIRPVNLAGGAFTVLLATPYPRSWSRWSSSCRASHSPTTVSRASCRRRLARPRSVPSLPSAGPSPY